MKKHFLSFELSKKLKEKGFECKYPFAMYNELGQFCSLFTSSDKYQCKSGYQYREYFDFDDFDEKDVIAPTAEQVLTWLIEEKRIYCLPHIEHIAGKWFFYVMKSNVVDEYPIYVSESDYSTYQEAAIAGIEYSLNLINN